MLMFQTNCIFDYAKVNRYIFYVKTQIADVLLITKQRSNVYICTVQKLAVNAICNCLRTSCLNAHPETAELLNPTWV